MNRRRFLQTAAASGAALFLPILRPGPAGEQSARADTPKKYEGPYFLIIHAGGGWDPTMVCDPKGDPINKQFPKGQFGAASGIKYAPLDYKDDGGKVVYSNQQFFDKWASKLLVVNGIDTTTGNHDTGTRAMWSGKVSDGYPTFSALVAAAKTPGNALGFISNGGYEQTAGLTSLTRMGNVDVVRRIAYPTRLDPNNANYLVHSQPTWERILKAQAERLDGMRRVETLPRVSRAMGSYYVARATDNDLTQLVAQLPPQSQIDRATNPLHRQSLVALASFKSGLGVAANLSIGGFDTHGNHDNAQGRALYTLLSGVDLILDEIKNQGLDGKVVVAVGSDFGRTPAYNAQNGKDHWNITSMLFTGPGITGGRQVGGSDDGFKALTVNATSLQPDPSGTRIRCDHVQRAMRKLAGVQESDAAKKFPVGAEELPLFG